MSELEHPAAVLRRAAESMRADALWRAAEEAGADKRGGTCGTFLSEVSDWLEIEAAALERRLPDDSGMRRIALRIARAYLGETETEGAGQ